MRRMLITALLVLVALVASLYHLGWLSETRPWTLSTGWDRIPAGERPAAPLEDEFQLTWLGHSGFLVRWQDVTLLLDPNTSPLCTATRRVMHVPADLSAVGHVDAVLISHAHYDHMDTPTLARIPAISATILPAGSEDYFTAAQKEHVRPRPIRVGETARVGALEITAVPAAHKGNRFHPLGGPRFAVGYMIRSPTRTLYFAGDTGVQLDFDALRERFHPDVAILPIGAFAPRFPLRYFHISPEDAVAAARKLGVQTVVPCHFGTFTLALDRPSSALPRFAAAAHAAGLHWVMPHWAGSEADLAAPPAAGDPR